MEFEEFLKDKKINANIISKNDKNDIVANIIGNNPHNVIRQKGYEKYILEKENKTKLHWTDYHSQYNFGQDINKDKYGTHQKIFIFGDKVLNIFNLKNYFNNKNEVKNDEN